MILPYPKYYCSWVLFVNDILWCYKSMNTSSVHDPKISGSMKLFPMISNGSSLWFLNAHTFPQQRPDLPHTHTHTNNSLFQPRDTVTLTVSLPVSRLMFRNTVTEPVTSHCEQLPSRCSENGNLQVWCFIVLISMGIKAQLFGLELSGTPCWQDCVLFNAP